MKMIFCRMDYLSFREKLLPLGCFSIKQINMFYPHYDVNNITRWVKNGYIIKLKRGLYAFAECIQERDMSLMIANQITTPSYISLHYALAYYGMIPETIVQLTSVTTQKTARYENATGIYTYQTINPRLFFGYQLVSITHTHSNGRTYMIATPEKALLDLLYLHPEYQTEDDFVQLRLDEDYLLDELNQARLNEYLQRWNSPQLNKRVKLLLKAYNI
jgi:predicted transcriptional regulator of viral defense system